MNEKQIDSLLESIKEAELAPLDRSSQDAIFAGLHAGMRQRRRRAYGVLAALALICVFLCGSRLVKKDDAASEFGGIPAVLAFAQELFPETGVAVVDEEIITFDHQNGRNAEKLLRLCMHRLDGKDPVTFAVFVSDNDYIMLTDGPVTGEIFVDSFSELQAVVIVDLEFSRPDGAKQKVKDAVVVHPTCGPTVIGSAPKDYCVEFVMDSIRKG